MKTILLATIGTTPAVLTETVWALAVNGKKCIGESIVPDEVVMFTYEKCIEPFCKAIFENEERGKSGWERLKESLRKRKINTKDKLIFGKPKIVSYEKDGVYILDAFDEGAMDAIANTFVWKINALRNDNNEPIRIIASVSGGRKPDGALLMSCMGLLGREGDKVVHLIPSFGTQENVTELKLTTPQFLFPEDGIAYSFTKADIEQKKFSKQHFRAGDVQLNLFEIPLLMTGKWYKAESGACRVISYSELLQEQQRRMQEGNGSKAQQCVEINLEEGIVLVNGKPIRKKTNSKPLRPAAFLVLVFESILGEQDEAFFVEFVNACKTQKNSVPYKWMKKLQKDNGPFRGNDAKHLDDLGVIRSELRGVLRAFFDVGIHDLAVIPKPVIANLDEVSKKLENLKMALKIC